MPRLAEADLCVGCSVCASICPNRCIEMEKDSDGFKYPVLMHLANCVECGMCESVCPVLSENIKANNEIPLAYAAFSQNEALRMESSSGGIFTELAKQILAENGIVFGAAYNEKFEVKHCGIEKESDLWKLRGAKYAQSDLGNSFSEILARLKNGQRVLFSGTPCQVAGLKAFVKKDYDNLFCVDFVCHGVPSPMAWKAYVEYRAEQDAAGKLPERINLRDKNTGWSNYHYSNVFEYENGKRHSIASSDSLFMKLFVGDYISRSSCEYCKFKGYSRVSDITLGDFWGIWDVDPEMDDNKGTSVVLLQSEKAKKIWQTIGSKIKCKEVSLEQASQQNPSMLNSAKQNPNRDKVLELIRAGKIGECQALFAVPKVSLLSRMKRKLKHKLGKG